MSDEAIRVDQCLFGYDDGHRLIASSTPLGDATATLTHLSDLASGTTFGRSEGYWTGLPVPKLKRYALMYTWPAPEMPRPGCVWTHALLLDLAIFDCLADLFQITAGFRRPDRAKDGESYSAPLTFSATVDQPSGLDPQFLPLADQLLDSLYDGEGKVLASAPGAMDRPVFAIWSQQWPRLRRNFRFQTAVSRSGAPNSDFKFDVLFRGADLEHQDSEAVKVTWKATALRDLLEPSRSDLRAFLQRYGGDVRKQRGSFRPLCEINTLEGADYPGAGHKLLELVNGAFPDADDAVQLKQDVVDGRLAPQTQLEILSALVESSLLSRLPPPSAESVQGLARFWPEHEGELMQLAEEASEMPSPASAAILETVTSALPVERFWTLTSSTPRIRRMMIEARPDLLLAQGVENLDSSTLLSYFDCLPSDARNGQRFVKLMLTRTDSPVVSAVYERYPAIAVREVVGVAKKTGHWPSGTWFWKLIDRADILFESGLITQLSRTSLLYDVADALGWISDATVNHGLKIWFQAFETAREDLPEDKRDVLYSFLIVLAFLQPGEDAKTTIERTFSTIHNRIMASRLSWKAQDILYPHLPELSWARNWDAGLRLRLAVAYSYITNVYDPSSFGRLELDRRVKDLLADAAEMFKGGKKYEKASRPK